MNRPIFNVALLVTFFARSTSVFIMCLVDCEEVEVAAECRSVRRRSVVRCIHLDAGSLNQGHFGYKNYFRGRNNTVRPTLYRAVLYTVPRSYDYCDYYVRLFTFDHQFEFDIFTINAALSRYTLAQLVFVTFDFTLT